MDITLTHFKFGHLSIHKQFSFHVQLKIHASLEKYMTYSSCFGTVKNGVWCLKNLLF